MDYGLAHQKIITRCVANWVSKWPIVTQREKQGSKPSWSGCKPLIAAPLGSSAIDYQNKVNLQDDERSLHRFKAKEHQEWLEKQERLKKENSTSQADSDSSGNDEKEDTGEGGSDDPQGGDRDDDSATQAADGGSDDHENESGEDAEAEGGSEWDGDEGSQRSDDGDEKKSSRKLSRVRRSNRVRKLVMKGNPF